MHLKKLKETIFMKNIKTLFFHFLTLTAVLVSFNVYAADQSICHSGAKVELNDDGSVKACRLKNDYDVNGIRCKNDGLITFYNNGNLESCVLSKPASIDMNKCMQDGQITFYINGNLKSCVKPN
jgi:hypothetical protein